MTNEEAIEAFKEWIERDKKIEYADWDENIEIYKTAIKALEQQPCEDCISRKAVKEMLVEEWTKYIPMELDINLSFMLEKISELPSVTPKAEWIPVKTRPMTEEEKEEIGHEYAFMYDCPLPDDGQDVLITDCYGNVEVDTFCSDYEGVYFETNCDDDDVVAWMPLPQPYEEVNADGN